MFPAKYQKKTWPLPYVACKNELGEQKDTVLLWVIFSPQLQTSLLNPPYGEVYWFSPLQV